MAKPARLNGLRQTILHPMRLQPTNFDPWGKPGPLFRFSCD
jgi:hypothetical protein